MHSQHLQVIGAHLLHIWLFGFWDGVMLDVEWRNVGIIHIDIYNSCDIFEDEEEEEEEEEEDDAR